MLEKNAWTGDFKKCYYVACPPEGSPNSSPKSQRPLIYYHEWHKKSANPHIYEPKPAFFFFTVLEQ